MLLDFEPTPSISAGMIQSGDLLAWKEDSNSTFSNFCVKTVRTLTRARYGHVGIAWRCHDTVDDELFVIEATIPKVRAARLTLTADFDCVPMGVEWDKKGKDFLMSKLGKDYSPRDAIRALLGIRLKNDDDFQCVELAHFFYKEYGILLEHDFTPGCIVKAASHYRQRPVLRVIPTYQYSLEDISS